MVLNSTFENLASFSLTLVTISYQNRALEKRIIPSISVLTQVLVLLFRAHLLQQET